MRTNPQSLLLTVCLAGLALAATSCNSHPVDYASTSGSVEHVKTINAGGGAQLDILWVIDNSQSMCQEQEQLRTNFERFIETLRQNPIDFHIGVTTSHFNSWSFEAVASPGQLQSTPHPPTGFADSCRFGSKDGELLDPNHPDGPDYSPVKNQIEAAVACTKNPDQYQKLLNWTNAEIECALYGNQFDDPDDNEPAACDKAGKDPNDFAAEQLFPCGFDNNKRCNKEQLKGVYRSIPKVLKASDYERENGTIRKDELRQDFQCMSFVGTRGHHYEQGLQAAVKAVSPNMTGGTVENPSNKMAPNHGFLRQDAQLATIFITDENDCSHEGNAIQSLAKQNSCGELNCYAPTKKDDQSPLLSTSKMAEEFKENVRKSKGGNFNAEEDLVMASIHGDRKTFMQTLPKDDDGNVSCGSQQTALQDNLTVCNTPLGSAKSGDRYEDFLRNFSTIFPERNESNPNAPLNGAMCAPTGDIGKPLENIAELIRPAPKKCITEDVMGCSSPEECPDYAYGSGDPDGKVCQQWGTNQDRNFCDSAIQVRIKPSPEENFQNGPMEALKSTGICIEESIGSREFPEGCVVRRNVYDWIACEGNEDGAIQLQWKKPIDNPDRQLAKFDVQLRYTEISNPAENTAGGNGEDAASMMGMQNMSTQ